jgi:DHA2 family multidrug resistance protein
MPAALSGMAWSALLTASVLQALDLTIATLALPAIEAALGLDVAAGSWILTSYIVAMALATPAAGALSAAIGRREALLLAIGGLTVASLAAAAAGNVAVLLAARLVQGAASGFIMPLVQATLLDLTPTARHGRAMSLLGAAAMVGPVLGPSLGGALVDGLGWRAVFLINLPIGLVAFIGVAASLRGLPKPPARRVDGVGLALFGAGIVALQLLLDQGKQAGWFAAPDIVLYAALAVGGLGAALVRTALRRDCFPLLTPFRERNFATTTGCSFLAGFVVIGSIVLVPSLLQTVLGYDATAAGLAMVPRGAGTMLTMLAMSRVVGTIDHRILLGVGSALNGLALLGFSRLGADWSLAGIGALSLLQGVGVGLIFTPLSTAAFSFLAPDLRADATGVYSLLRNVGGSVGVAVLTALLVGRGPASELAAAYRLDFLLLLALTAAMAAAMLPIRTGNPAAVPEASAGEP